jgi:hypothetical protein
MHELLSTTNFKCCQRERDTLLHHILMVGQIMDALIWQRTEAAKCWVMAPILMCKRLNNTTIHITFFTRGFCLTTTYHIIPLLMAHIMPNCYVIRCDLLSTGNNCNCWCCVIFLQDNAALQPNLICISGVGRYWLAHPPHSLHLC